MAEITLKATTGRELGSGPSKRLRANGEIPAVVYGLGKDPVAVAVAWRPLREALTTEAGLNALIDLDIDGDVALAMVKELQRHPIRGDVLHIDFLRVSADAAISVDVPVVLEGEADVLLGEGGAVDQVLHALTISAKPADIPNEIAVDITDLVIGATIRVGDLTLPKGVTTDVDAEEAVVTGAAPIAEEALETEAAEGEAEAAEAEGAEGEAGEAAEAGEGEGGEATEGEAETEG
jgi:large subunit ribosomal protein L25